MFFVRQNKVREPDSDYASSASDTEDEEWKAPALAKTLEDSVVLKMAENQFSELTETEESDGRWLKGLPYIDITETLAIYAHGVTTEFPILEASISPLCGFKIIEVDLEDEKKPAASPYSRRSFIKLKNIRKMITGKRRKLEQIADEAKKAAEVIKLERKAFKKERVREFFAAGALFEEDKGRTGSCWRGGSLDEG